MSVVILCAFLYFGSSTILFILFLILCKIQHLNKTSDYVRSIIFYDLFH